MVRTNNILHYTCRIGKWIAAVILGVLAVALLLTVVGLIILGIDWIMHNVDWLKYLGPIISIVFLVFVVICAAWCIHEFLDDAVHCPKKKR